MGWPDCGVMRGCEKARFGGKAINEGVEAEAIAKLKQERGRGMLPLEQKKQWAN